MFIFVAAEAELRQVRWSGFRRSRRNGDCLQSEAGLLGTFSGGAVVNLGEHITP